MLSHSISSEYTSYILCTRLHSYTHLIKWFHIRSLTLTQSVTLIWLTFDTHSHSHNWQKRLKISIAMQFILLACSIVQLNAISLQQFTCLFQSIYIKLTSMFNHLLERRALPRVTWLQLLSIFFSFAWSLDHDAAKGSTVYKKKHTTKERKKIKKHKISCIWGEEAAATKPAICVRFYVTYTWITWGKALDNVCVCMLISLLQQVHVYTNTIDKLTCQLACVSFTPTVNVINIFT